MSWDCGTGVIFDDATERYGLYETCIHDCNTYQCVDEPSTQRFIKWLTDEEVAAMYPHSQSK